MQIRLIALPSFAWAIDRPERAADLTKVLEANKDLISAYVHQESARLNLERTEGLVSVKSQSDKAGSEISAAEKLTEDVKAKAATTTAALELAVDKFSQELRNVQEPLGWAIGNLTAERDGFERKFYDKLLTANPDEFKAQANFWNDAPASLKKAQTELKELDKVLEALKTKQP